MIVWVMLKIIILQQHRHLFWMLIKAWIVKFWTSLTPNISTIISATSSKWMNSLSFTKLNPNFIELFRLELGVECCKPYMHHPWLSGCSWCSSGVGLSVMKLSDQVRMFGFKTWNAMCFKIKAVFAVVQGHVKGISIQNGVGCGDRCHGFVVSQWSVSVRLRKCQ